MGASAALIGASTALAGLASVVTIPFVPQLACPHRRGACCSPPRSAGSASPCCRSSRRTMSIAWWFSDPLRGSASGSAACSSCREFSIKTSAAAPARRGLRRWASTRPRLAGRLRGRARGSRPGRGPSGWPPYLAGTALLRAGVPAASSPPAACCPTSGLGAAGAASSSSWLAAPAADPGLVRSTAGIETANLARSCRSMPVSPGFSGRRKRCCWVTVAGARQRRVPRSRIGWLADMMDRRLLLAGDRADRGLRARWRCRSSARAYLPLHAVLFVWGGIIGGPLHGRAGAARRPLLGRRPRGRQRGLHRPLHARHDRGPAGRRRRDGRLIGPHGFAATRWRRSSRTYVAIVTDPASALGTSRRRVSRAALDLPRPVGRFAAHPAATRGPSSIAARAQAQRVAAMAKSVTDQDQAAVDRRHRLLSM